MIPLETFRGLFDYNYWARDRQQEACTALTAEQFLRPLGSSYSSLRDTLAHLVGAEWVWLERWRGHSPTPAEAGAFAAEKFPTLAVVEERWRGVERGLREYLQGLEETALGRPLTYQNLKGETWSYLLWRTLLHVVNHQTYHRGQVTTLLRQLGAQAAQIDFLVFQATPQASLSGGAIVPLAALLELYEYSYWARDRQLEACATLTEEQLHRPLSSSFSSLRDTLVHLVEAECVWLDGWQGRSPRTRLSADDFPTLSAVRERWREVERHLRAYLQTLDEPALAQPLTRTSHSHSTGQTWTYPHWQTLLHLLNHQTYHRGQVTTLLRQLGAQPPQIDYLVAHDVGFGK